MDSLVVERVDPYTSGDESASVALRSERGSIDVFCSPCNLTVGDRITNHLTALDADARAAYLSDWSEEEKAERSAERLEKIGPYAYRGCGVVVDRSCGLISVLGFRIELGDVPCDGPVEFECLRVDL